MQKQTRWGTTVLPLYLFWQSVKISAKENCLYGIIEVQLLYLIVTRHLNFTINQLGVVLFC